MQLRTLASFKNLYTRHLADALTFSPLSLVHPSIFIYKLFHPEVRLDQGQQTNGRRRSADDIVPFHHGNCWVLPRDWG